MNVYIYHKLIKASVLPLTVNILQLSTDSKTNAHCSQSAKSMECSIRTYPFCFLTLFVFLDLLPCFWICCTFLFTIAVLYVLNLWSIIRITLDGNKVQFGGGSINIWCKLVALCFYEDKIILFSKIIFEKNKKEYSKP